MNRLLILEMYRSGKVFDMNVKGTAVQTIPMFIKSKFGNDGYDRWLVNLPEATRKQFAGTLLASAWYPITDMLIQPTLKVCELFYRNSLAGAEELGQFSADHALKGIYKLFLKLGSVDFIVSKASSIMSTYYENSAMSIAGKADKKLILRITQFQQPHDVVELRIKGWILRALQLSGAKDVAIAIPQSLAKGASATDFVISWV